MAKLTEETTKALTASLKVEAATLLNVMKSNGAQTWKNGVEKSAWADVKKRAQDTIMKANGKQILNRLDSLKRGLHDAAVHEELAHKTTRRR